MVVPKRENCPRGSDDDSACCSASASQNLRSPAAMSGAKKISEGSSLGWLARSVAASIVTTLLFAGPSTTSTVFAAGRNVDRRALDSNRADVARRPYRRARHCRRRSSRPRPWFPRRRPPTRHAPRAVVLPMAPVCGSIRTSTSVPGGRTTGPRARGGANPPAAAAATAMATAPDGDPPAAPAPLNRGAGHGGQSEGSLRRVDQCAAGCVAVVGELRHGTGRAARRARPEARGRARLQASAVPPRAGRR